MGNIKAPWLLYAKGVLFVLLGLLAAVLVFVERPTLKVAILLCVSIWAFARAYYFAFYVIEHYIDGEYRFSGLSSFLVYVCRKRGRRTSR